MTVFEADYSGMADNPNTRQRWSNYLVICLGVLSVLLLIRLRGDAFGMTATYQNAEAGLMLEYPQSWLLDSEDPDEFVFQARDMRETGFKTTFRIRLLPVADTTPRRVILDTLSMQRAQELLGYRTLSVSPYGQLNNTDAIIVSYQYIDGDQNPFQESLPAIVRGADILVFNRDQAITITLLSDNSTFDSNFQRFEQFLETIEF